MHGFFPRACIVCCVMFCVATLRLLCGLRMGELPRRILLSFVIAAKQGVCMSLLVDFVF